MNDIFRDILEQYVLVYLDVILVYSRTLEEHLGDVLDRLRRHGFYAKLSKCRFAQHKVDFLGHYVSDQGLHMDDAKITVVSEWPVPTSVEQLHNFLGLTSDYSNFIQGYARYSYVLTSTHLWKNPPWAWTPLHEDAFRALKKAVTCAPILRLPDFDRPFILTTDATDFVLESQNQELQQQYQNLKKQHQELANLRRTVQSHEDATRALNSRVLDLEQAVPGPDAGVSSSEPSNRQLEEPVDHVVAMLGDISTFAAPTTISSRMDTLKIEVQQLQLPNKEGNNTTYYKMPTFQIEKFDDYTHQDPIEEASCSALIDCGASRNYISQDFMVRVGLGPHVRRKPQPTQVTLADGHTHKSIDRCIDDVPVYFAPHASEAVSFDILDTKFDMILGMLWLRSEDHPVNFYHRTVHIRDRNGVLVSCTVPLPHPSISSHVVSAASMRASIIRDDIEEMGVCFLRALPPYDASSTDSSSDPHITELLDAYGDVFEGPHGVVPDRPIRHEIILEDGAVPPRGCIYRMSEEELSVLRAQLDDLLEKGWIQPSSSPYGAPVLFVRKKNKDLQLCIDYRKLNAQTIRNVGPLPCIDDLLERLGGAKFFSKLDLKSGYYQLEIRQEDRYKTAFKTRYGHFEWLVMPFGLTNAPTTFQAAMTTEFRHMLDRYVLIYLDDILVYSRSLDEHVEHLRTVLERLRQVKYKANLDKCEFARQELENLGHNVTPQGIRPLADKIEALRVWPEPTNTTGVRSFMGLAGYNQRFIIGYSRIVAPMTRLQSPKVPFVFDDDARRSFQALKTAMLMAPVLSIYDPTLPTRVTTDASGYGIGAVLEQHDVDDWHPVEYFSHKVPPINSLDDARKKELLAFVMALKRWRHFLLGRRRLIWVTNNNPLTYYKTQDTRHFIRGYESDPDFATLYAQLPSDHPPASHYRIADGYLLLHSRGKDLLCVPRDRRLRTRLLGEYHDSRLAGHFGVNRTIARLRQRFRWPDLITDVTRYCDSCEVCRRSKPRNRNPYGELRPMPIPQEPGLSIAMDVTEQFPCDRLGHDCILTVVDRLSKYARFLPCKYYSTAPELARLLHTGWICGHGVPEDIVSDRDTRFMSAFWTALMQESDTKMKPSSARHPQTDGQKERAHQTAQMMLRMLIRPDQKDWVDRLPDIEFAYNTSVHPAIGGTPFELHHGGRKGLIFVDLLLPRPADINVACSPASVRKYRELLAQARANMQKAQVRMQQQANRHRVPCPIRAGDLVWVSAEEFALEQDFLFLVFILHFCQDRMIHYVDVFEIGNIIKADWKLQMDAAPETEKPQYQFFYEKALKREEEEKDRERRDKVQAHEAVFSTVSALTDEEVEEKTVTLLRSLVEVRVAEDHTGQFAQVFKQLKELREDTAKMVQRHRDQLQQFASSQQAQVVSPLTYPASNAACQSSFAPLTMSTSSPSTSSSSLSVGNSQSGSAASPDPADAAAAAAASGCVGNSGTVAVPSPDPAMAGPSDTLLTSTGRRRRFRPTKARLKLDKLKHNKWTGTMHNLQQYVSKLFATPDLEMTAQSCLDVIKVLQQDDGDGLRPLEFYSKRMPSHKVAASTYMRELYALREALDHWKHYLLGRHFKVFSDHETLKWVQTQNNPSTTLTRWLHEFVVYDFEIKHKKGCYNRVADALSRHPEYMTCLVGSDDLRKNLKEELIQHTAKDPELSPILKQIRVYPSSQPDFHECKGLLFRRYGKHDRLCVPNHEPIMTNFLDLAHGRSGHFGVEKTYGNLLEKFMWPGMKRMTQRFVAECEVCQRIKSSRQKPYGLLHPLPIPDGPGESVSIDFTDMGKKSRNGYSQVMVIVDRFSKFLNLIPLPPHAPTDLVIEEFNKRYIPQCGPPKTLVSDRDIRFISADWKEFTSQTYDMKLKMTPGRHPEANGLAEEINQTVIQLLRALIVPDQNSWDEELPIVQGFRTVLRKTQDTVNDTIARWMAFIDEFNFFPDYILGKSNRFADALSRRLDYYTAIYSTFEIGDNLRDSFIRSYKADPEFRDKYVNCSSPNPGPSHYRTQEGYLLVHTRGKDLLCVSSDFDLRTWLLGEFQDAPATGHFGVNLTIGRLRERFWWSGLLDDVARYCESCEVYRRCKSRNYRPYGELRPLPVPLRRREAIAMDIVGPFPKHKTGVDGILTVVDRLTKFAMFLPCRYHATALELAEVLYKLSAQLMSGSDPVDDRADNRRLTRADALRVPHVFRTLDEGEERRLRAERRARALAAGLQEANRVARERATAARATTMANGTSSATSSSVSSSGNSGTQLGMSTSSTSSSGTSGSTGSRQSSSQMAGLQFSPLTARERELREIQEVERLRQQLEEDLKKATDREKEIKSRAARLDTLEADKAALEGSDESSLSDPLKVLRDNMLSLHAHVDSRMDFMQSTLDQILDALTKPGFRPPAQSPLPLTAMSGPFAVQIGTQPSVWVKSKRTLLEDEVVTAASYLEGKAAKWLDGVVVKAGYGRRMADWAKSLTLDQFMEMVEARWHNPQEAQRAIDAINKLDQRKFSAVKKLHLGMKVQQLQQPLLVRIGDSTVLTIREKVRGIPVTFDSAGEVGHSLNFYIFPDLPFDLVFSVQWLRAVNPRIDWQIPKIELPNGQGVYQTCRIATEHHPKTSCYCLRAREFYSLSRLYDHELLFLALVKQTNGPPVSCPPEIQQVVDQYADLMQEPFGLPNRPTKHHIELLPGAVPPKGRIYRMSPVELEELRRQLETLTSKGWIRPSTSEFGTSVLFVPKGNGEFRMCIDYRGLNKITRKSTEPLPRIDDLLDMVQGCTVFSKVDVKSGYHQIEMAEEDVYKTAFKTRYGTYEFLVMPFGLCNAPGTFQTEMHRIFRPYLDKFMIVYLDDILVFSRTAREHAKHLTLVLQSLRDSQYKINREKSSFGVPSVIYLVLQQDDGNGLQPIEFMSKKIKTQKLRDSTYEKELYALVCALKHWKHFLLGRHFKIFSDHSTLQWMKSQGELNDKLARYIQFIDMFDFELKHKKGCYNKGVYVISINTILVTDSFLQAAGGGGASSGAVVGASAERASGFPRERDGDMERRTPEAGEGSRRRTLQTESPKLKLASGEEILIPKEGGGPVAEFGLGPQFRPVGSRRTLGVTSRPLPATEAADTNPNRSTTAKEEEVITAASYLEGKAAKWLDGIVAKVAYRRRMADWGKTLTLEEFLDMVEARWHNPQQAQIATDAMLRLDQRKYKSVRELTTTVENLIVVPGIRYDDRVLLTMFLRCLPENLRNLLASEARLEYHSFETFYRKALDLEATLGSVQPTPVDGRKKKSPQEWKKKGSRLMMVESDGTQTEIEELTDPMDSSEYGGKETVEGNTLAAVVKTKAALEDLESEWSSKDPRESWVALSRGPRGEHFVVEVAVGGRKCGAFIDIGSTRNYISRDYLERLHLKDRVQHLSRPVASTLANKERMVVTDYVKGVVCTFSYGGGELNHKISFLVSDDLPFDMLLGMYYLEVAKPQFDWDKKVLKHKLQDGRTVRLAKYKASSLIESYGCLCASALYNYYKQNQEEGMYLVYVSEKGEAVKTPSEIEHVVAKFPNLFEEPTGVVEREIVHAIKIIPGSKTPKGRIYRMAPTELDELRRQLKELTKKDWIRPSTSPFKSPALFVPKKGGTLRMCIDYRGLNAITVKNTEPLSRIDDLLDRVQGCKYCSKINFEFGYHQIAIRPEDQHKTAFQTRYGLHEFVVMPFGLRNAPGTFQHAMNKIFHDYLDKFVVVYLDDILIFSKSVEEHAQHVETILSLLRQHKYKVNLEKCEFGRTKILYLGHEVSAEGIRPEDAKVASIRDWPRPQTVTEVRSFLGMCGYYRNFVKNYSTVASPLTNLTRLDTPWDWSDECEAAFKRLKHALMNHEALIAGSAGWKKLRPIEYMSKKMPSKKLAKSTYERELYALYKALGHWRHFLLGRFFYLRTDHQTLKWIKTQPTLSALKRWIEVIDQYDFKLEYLKGEYNKVADALSHRADYRGALIYEFGVSEEVTQSLVGAYQEDAVTMDIIRKLQANDKATKDEFVMVDGLLFLDKAEFKRSVIPSSERLRSLFLGECHDATGHFGYKKTSANLVQRFWWPGMLEDAKKYVETCQYEKLLQQAVEHIRKSQQAMIAFENKHRRQSSFQVGERVRVKASELGQEFGISRKLMPQYFGPWEVLDIIGDEMDGPTYVIRIPGHLRTHLVFHASKLAPFAETDQFPSRRSMLPPAMDGQVDIDDIVDHRDIPVPKPLGRGRPPKPKREYRVRFRHHTDPKEDRWFTREELIDTAPQVVAEYERMLKGKAPANVHSAGERNSQDDEEEQQIDEDEDLPLRSRHREAASMAAVKTPIGQLWRKHHAEQGLMSLGQFRTSQALLAGPAPPIDREYQPRQSPALNRARC
ncbi:hypothetical protein CBR_g21076 [Chara braunii]|uniref:RNA-directed DNA polymerase n=1 Tax=Chara braunii TaxID=69332 RepID=A0A388L0S0_CHABU|nr:hypothetical protein CBR_g21076 [Chara braunii]|eukprot:GBG75832.1 hypothetical protein CBR_g21076 [Chara braunii]